jgi:cyclophilin family peptidyl-prolyl cis-trans isomerase
MNRSRSLIAILLIAASCGEKTEVVTNENVNEVLIRYGESHPEKDVIIETSYGTMKIRLYDDTPLHRANFIKQINEDYYGDDGTFYRIINKFMIQGGVQSKQLDYLVPAEFNPNHYHKRGAIAMAHYDEGNPEMKSSPTEFYIMQGQIYTEEDVAFEEQERKMKMTPRQKEDYMTIGGDFSLDQKYTVFGEVIEGFDVIAKIANEKTYSTDKPVSKIPFTIKTVKQ